MLIKNYEYCFKKSNYLTILHPLLIIGELSIIYRVRVLRASRFFVTLSC